MKRILLFLLLIGNFFVSSANTRLTSYRWRNDDGSETSATWKAAINTPISVTDQSNLRLRIAMEETGNSSGQFTEAVYLEYSVNGGSYVTITGSGSEAFVMQSSSFVADNTITTQQISPNPFINFEPGYVRTSDAISYYTIDGGSGSFWEHEFCIKPTASFSPTATYNFRVASFSTGSINTPTIQPSPASSLSFDGIDDYVFCDDILPTTYTKEAWVYLTNSSLQNNFISGGGDGEHAFWAPNTNGNKLASGHNGDWYAVEDTAPLAFNTWTHVAVTYDSNTTTMKLYKNGDLVSTNTNVSPFLGGPAVRLGAFSDNANLFEGFLDEVRVWSRVLTNAEIMNNMNCELGGSQTDLVAHYKFNQGNANQSNAGLTTLADSSGANNNGNLINFTLNGTTSNWSDAEAVTTGVTCSPFLSSTSFNNNMKVTYYPNPTENVLHITNQEVITNVEVFNLVGQKVLSVPASSQSLTIDLSALPTNAYLVKISSGENTATVKVLKN